MSNVASERVLEKVGFKREHIVRIDDAFVDMNSGEKVAKDLTCWRLDRPSGN